MSAARSSSSVRTWWAADRTAGAIEASVIEPPEKGPCPIRDVSPACTRDRVDGHAQALGGDHGARGHRAGAEVLEARRMTAGRAALPTRTSA